MVSRKWLQSHGPVRGHVYKLNLIRSEPHSTVISPVLVVSKFDADCVGWAGNVSYSSNKSFSLENCILFTCELVFAVVYKSHPAPLQLHSGITCTLQTTVRVTHATVYGVWISIAHRHGVSAPAHIYRCECRHRHTPRPLLIRMHAYGTMICVHIYGTIIYRRARCPADVRYAYGTMICVHIYGTIRNNHIQTRSMSGSPINGT